MHLNLEHLKKKNQVIIIFSILFQMIIKKIMINIIVLQLISSIVK